MSDFIHVCTAAVIVGIGSGFLGLHTGQAVGLWFMIFGASLLVGRAVRS